MTTATKKYTMSDKVKLREVEAWPQSLQERFWGMVDAGQSVSMAHMLASRQSPGLATDDQFLNQEFSLKNRVSSAAQRKNILKKARAAGICVDETCRYEPGLGKGPADPTSWFKHGEGKAELQKRLNARGANAVHNLPVGIKAPTPHNKPPAPTPGLAPDLVNEIERNMVAQDPALATKDRRKLREMIIDKHGTKPRKVRP